MSVCYEIATALERISKGEGHSPIDYALEEIFPDTPGGEARIRLVGMFDHALDEVAHLSNIPERHINKMLANLREMQVNALLGASATQTLQFVQTMKAGRAINDLELIGHTVSSARISGTRELNRKEFLEDTLELVAALDTANIDERSKSFIRVKLLAIQRVLSECRGMSDDQIRLRIKAIMADLTAQFDAMSKAPGFFEKFEGFASKAMRGGAFAIGLTVDVAGLVQLSGPVAAALIEYQQAPKQIEYHEGGGDGTTDV